MNYAFVHVAGDTLDREISVPDYPSTDGWTLTYYLTPRFTTPAQAQITVTASANASGTYQLQSPPTETATWTPGPYSFKRLVSKSGARQTLTGTEEQGEVLIRPDPTTEVQGADSRTHERKMLEAIEAVIENRASSTQREMIEYTIGTRGQKFDPSESKAALLELHSKYKWLVANEDARAQIAAGQPNPRDISIRFTGG